jgi:hypothetical protein
MSIIRSELIRADGRVRSSRLPLRGIVQVVGIAWAYILYGGFRNLATGPTVVSMRDAEKVLSVERFLHLDFERSVQAFALQYSWLVHLCSAVYTLTHLAVPAVVLVLLYRRMPARYAVARDTFLVLLGLALLGFALFPTTPPWLMPSSYGFVDTAHVLAHGHQATHFALDTQVGPTASSLFEFSNPFAAMPSLHVTWALWAAFAAWPAVRRRSVRVLLAVYPPLMLLSVTVTANHWFLDSLVGAALLAVAYGVARAINQLRIRQVGWFRTRGAPAETAWSD